MMVSVFEEMSDAFFDAVPPTAIPPGLLMHVCKDYLLSEMPLVHHTLAQTTAHVWCGGCGAFDGFSLV